MTKIRYIQTLLLLFLLLGCNKKEYPKDVIVDNQATFFSNLVVNGTPLNLEAGKNGYYLYTSYKQDSTGLYHFIGELKSQDQSNGNPTALKLEIKDIAPVAPNAPSKLNDFLIPGTYNYFDGSYTSAYGIEFESTYNRTAKNYKWDFGDNSISNEPKPVHYFKTNSSYYTCLTIDGSNGCSSSNCNTINLKPNAINAFVSATNLASQTLFFHANVIGGKAPYTYQWSFGDGLADQTSDPKHTYVISGSYPVTLKVTDANSNTIQSNYNVVTASDISSCATNIRIKSILPEIQNLGYSEITLTYTDQNGKTFISSTRKQNSSSLFSISKVENYENNEFGQKTKKISVNLNCQLFSGIESVQIESQQSIFCIAYK